jgi:hypothetical protein
MIFIPLTIVRMLVAVVLKEPFLGWRIKYVGRLRSSWTSGSALLLSYNASLCKTATCCRQSTKIQTVLLRQIAKRVIFAEKSNALSPQWSRGLSAGR